MCTIITADYLLAMALSAKKSVSVQYLSDLQSTVEAQLPDVVVDISSPSVHAALKYYPEIFEKETNGVVRAPKAEEYLESPYLQHEFTSLVPPRVHKTVTRAIKALA